MPRICKILAILLALLPGAAFGAEMLRLQAKADELYHDGHWERAYFIYVNDLAAIGDKYSQYMAGYMCLHGRGVERDSIKASAWYRLAAERGSREFVEVRDKLLESLSDEQKALSDSSFVELRRRFGDLALLIAQLEQDRAELLEPPTGTRLFSETSSILMIEPQKGTTTLRSDYLRSKAKRMQVKLDYIADRLGIEKLDPYMGDAEFARLVRQVDDHLQVIDDR